MNKMFEDKRLWDLIMEAVATCANEYLEAPEEDRPLIIARWTDNIHALVFTMLVHDKAEDVRG